MKGFPIEMYFLDKVDIYSKHFISTEVKPFFTGKMVEMNDEDSAQKVQKKCIKGAQKSAQKVILLYWYFCQ